MEPRIDINLGIAGEPDKWVHSACILCSNGCGLDIGVKDGKIVGVRGDPTHLVNFGHLGPKGKNGWVANHSARRGTTPMLRRHKHAPLEPVGHMVTPFAALSIDGSKTLMVVAKDNVAPADVAPL